LMRRLSISLPYSEKEIESFPFLTLNMGTGIKLGRQLGLITGVQGFIEPEEYLHSAKILDELRGLTFEYIPGNRSIFEEGNLTEAFLPDGSVIGPTRLGIANLRRRISNTNSIGVTFITADEDFRRENARRTDGIIAAGAEDISSLPQALEASGIKDDRNTPAEILTSYLRDGNSNTVAQHTNGIIVVSYELVKAGEIPVGDEVRGLQPMPFRQFMLRDGRVTSYQREYIHPNLANVLFAGDQTNVAYLQNSAIDRDQPQHAFTGLTELCDVERVLVRLSRFDRHLKTRLSWIGVDLKAS
jgi:hypothetical protein